MKKLILCLVILVVSNVALAMDADFFGYLRGGTGTNSLSGKQECFNNQGIPGNFLRLGNECSFYSEIGMVFNHKKPSETDSAFFRTQVRLVMQAPGYTQWEDASKSTVNQMEAFVTAGGLSEIPGDVWVGKRFYRDVDLHIFDWYYYGEMNGVGAGIENIKTDHGLFSIAHLIQTNETLTTDHGRPTLQAIDLRFNKLPLTSDQYLNFWGAYGWAPRGSDATTEYVATNGYVLASRLEGKLGEGTNNFALEYGKGAMSGFSMWGQSAVASTDDSQNRSWAVRAVENWNKEVTDRWAILFGLAGEYGDSGKDVDHRRFYYEIGIRPVYYVTDRFQWVTEFGYSRIEDESEKDASNNPLGERDLSRITIAPQLSLSKSVWGRPVLRAYATYSTWNKNNQTKIAGNAPSYKDKTAGSGFGYQFEAWF